MLFLLAATCVCRLEVVRQIEWSVFRKMTCAQKAKIYSAIYLNYYPFGTIPATNIFCHYFNLERW